MRKRLAVAAAAAILAASLAYAVLAQDAPAPRSDSAPDPASDPARIELQAEIESGADLSSRARKVLFRARTHQDAGRFAESAGILREWLDGAAERSHPLLHFQEALAHLGLGEREAALESLRSAVETEPRFARAWLRLGEIAYDLQQYDAAAEAFARGYDLNPVRRPEFLYYRCVALLGGARAGEALGDLETLLTEYRAAAQLDWYRALVSAGAEAEQPARVEPYVDALLADLGEDAAAWELAYRHAAGRGDYESAAVYLTVTGYLRELSAAEWNQLGDLYAVIDVPLQAARCYEIALGSAAPAAENGGAAEVRNLERLAGAWLAAHRHEEARAALRSALSRRESRRLWALLGDLEYQVEDWAGALEAYTRGTALDPEFGRGWLMMGYCARELDRGDEAREYLTRASEFPEHAAGARMLMEE